MVQLVSRTVVIQKEKFHYKFFSQEACSSLVQLQASSHLEKTIVQLAHSRYDILKFFLKLDFFFFPQTSFPATDQRAKQRWQLSEGPSHVLEGRVQHLGALLLSRDFGALKPLEILDWPWVPVSPSFQLWICSKAPCPEWGALGQPPHTQQVPGLPSPPRMLPGKVPRVKAAEIHGKNPTEIFLFFLNDFSLEFLSLEKQNLSFSFWIRINLSSQNFLKNMNSKVLFSEKI